MNSFFCIKLNEIMLFCISPFIFLAFCMRIARLKCRIDMNSSCQFRKDEKLKH